MKQLKQFALTENELYLLMYALGTASGVLHGYQEMRETTRLIGALIQKIDLQASDLSALADALPPGGGEDRAAR